MNFDVSSTVYRFMRNVNLERSELHALFLQALRDHTDLRRLTQEIIDELNKLNIHPGSPASVQAGVVYGMVLGVIAERINNERKFKLT